MGGFSYGQKGTVHDIYIKVVSGADIAKINWFQLKRFPSGIQGVQQTRPFLEWHILKRVNSIPNITFQYRSLIKGFILSDDQKTLQGVKVQDRSSLTEEKLMTDLVVDASGAGSQTLNWLNIEKDEKDTAEIVKIDLFYATRFYKTESVDRGWMNLMISAKLPDYPYAGIQVISQTEFCLFII